MEQKKGIPRTGIIRLQLEEGEWPGLGVIRDFDRPLDIVGFIDMENGATEAKVVISTLKVYKPGSFRPKTQESESRTSEQESSGFVKIRDFLSRHLEKSAWMLVGHIGASKKPIVILHYESIKVTVYSLDMIVKNAEKNPITSWIEDLFGGTKLEDIFK